MDTPITDLLNAISEQAHLVATTTITDSARLSAAHELIGRYEDLLDFLKLRAYTAGDDSPSYPGASTEYAVVDLIEGVSIAVQRRADDLYVHVDVTETPDQVIDFEINGAGGGTFDVS